MRLAARFFFFLASLFSLTFISSGILSPAPCRADIFDDYGETENSFDFQAEAGLFNRRMFRGEDLYNGFSVQPRLRAQANIDEQFSFYLEAFSHLDTGSVDNDHDHPAFSELDYDLGGLAKFEPFTVHFGHRWYSYSKRTDRLDNTGEFFSKLQFESIIRTHLETNYDWDAHKGWYTELGAEVPVDIDLSRTEAAIIPFANLGYSAGLADGSEPIYAEDGFTALDFGVRAEFYLKKDLYIEPLIQYTAGFDEKTDSAITVGVRFGGKASIK